MTAVDEHRRSVAFIERDGESWACFLVTRPHAASGRWHGFFSFRPGHGGFSQDDVRTADIFIEASEAEIHNKARGLGRPLLGGLLASALHTTTSVDDRLTERFRELIAEKSGRLATNPEPAAAQDHPTRSLSDDLRSLYASYRLDQVAHFIALVDPLVFEDVVDRILDGKRIDFRAKDRIQFAMMVVEHIETLLPLPPFEIWAEDYLAQPERYRLYTHTLHREGRLP